MEDIRPISLLNEFVLDNFNRLGLLGRCAEQEKDGGCQGAALLLSGQSQILLEIRVAHSSGPFGAGKSEKLARTLLGESSFEGVLKEFEVENMERA